MELNTPEAVRQIKSCCKDYAVVEGKKQSLLQAMSFALKFHKLNLIDQNGELFVKGTPQQQQDTGLGTDIHANMMDQIAITPCTTDLTDQTILQRLRLP